MWRVKSSSLYLFIAHEVPSTWQDGLAQTYTQYTNIMVRGHVDWRLLTLAWRTPKRLARSIHYKDNRHNPPVPQIVYYSSGVGSSNSNVYTHVINGWFHFWKLYLKALTLTCRHDWRLNRWWFEIWPLKRQLIFVRYSWQDRGRLWLYCSVRPFVPFSFPL